jgi:hypothetical protein
MMSEAAGLDGEEAVHQQWVCLSTTKHTWDPHLHQVKLFSKLVDGIPHISGQVIDTSDKSYVNCLTEVIDNVYFFVKEAQQQTTECAYFYP